MRIYSKLTIFLLVSILCSGTVSCVCTNNASEGFFSTESTLVGNMNDTEESAHIENKREDSESLDKSESEEPDENKDLVSSSSEPDISSMPIVSSNPTVSNNPATSRKPTVSSSPEVSSEPGVSSVLVISSTPTVHIHSYQTEVTLATCTTPGYTTYICSCGDSYKGDSTSALEHNFGAWIVTQSASTTTEGTEIRTCGRCSVTESRSIAKLPVTDKYSVPATSSNIALLQERTLYYINKFRNEQGSATATTLPKQQAYAEYRAKQLTTNYAHDVTDEQVAAEALQYGRYYSREYLDSINCPNDPPFWQPVGGEAIGCARGYDGESIDLIAKTVATGWRNSPGHWGYVGNNSNIYITVGAAYYGAEWYFAIITNDTDIYG